MGKKKDKPAPKSNHPKSGAHKRRKPANTHLREKKQASDNKNEQDAVSPRENETSNDQVGRRQDKLIFRQSIYFLAKWWVRGMLAVISIIGSGVISVAIGLNTPAPPPLLDNIHRYPTPSIVIVIFFMLISFLAWFISRGPAPTDNQANSVPRTQPYRRLVIATIMSTTSSILCLTLLTVVLIRPPWCPTLLCPSPKLILNPQGFHDNNLEVYYQTVESSLFMLPEDPSHYTQNNLPKGVSVKRVDVDKTHPYRVVLGVHSLQQGRFGMIIEQVALVVKQVALIPYPLRIWIKDSFRDYHSNPYRVTYAGEDVGAVLTATYVPLSVEHLQLIPGESDELDIEVLSHDVIDLRFQLQVTYRIVNEFQQHTLTLPNVFEVIFSDASNWYPYRLRNGYLVPSS